MKDKLVKGKKFFKSLVLVLVFALGVGILPLSFGVFTESDVVVVYAKKRGIKKKNKKKPKKKYKKVLKEFESVAEGYGDRTNCYVDGKNDKIYINVIDFFGSLQGTLKEAKIKVNAKSKTVKVTVGKKYKESYDYFDAPKEIYGKPTKIKVAIAGNIAYVKGYVVKENSYWSLNKAIYVDFDEIAEKLDLVFEKDIAGKRYLLYTKLPENIMELKSDKSHFDSYSRKNSTEINLYDVDERWASPIYNYLYEEDGNLVRVEAVERYYAEDEKKDNVREVTVKRYDSSGNFITSKVIPYQGEKFGGFYRGEENNYLIFGNNNEKCDDNKEVVRIVKFDRNFNEIGSLSVNGAYTVYPFDSGSLRCAEIGNTVLVHTSRERYDGHQSQLTMAFNEDTMTLLNADDLGEFQKNHVSHDFNEFAMSDGSEFITVDHGDAYPRTIKVSWLRTVGLPQERVELGAGWYKIKHRGAFSISKEKDIFNIPGEEGANQTGVSIGSTLNTVNKVLVSVNRIDYSKATSFDSFYIKGKDVYKRDVVLYSLDKKTLEVTENKYTDYNLEKNVTYTAPKMVKLDDTRIMLIWNKLNKSFDDEWDSDDYDNKPQLQYVIVDENGNKLSDIKVIDGMKIADETPIVYNGKVVWSEYRKGRLVLNTIPVE